MDTCERDKQDSIIIHPSEFERNQRKFYVGVYAEQESQFSILAIISNTTVPLVDGIPFRGMVEQKKYRYYEVFNPYTSGVSIELTVDSPDDADLYISRKTKRPSPLDYEYKSDNIEKDVVRIDSIPPGWLYIAVHGYFGSTIQYTISATLDYRVLANNQEVYAFSPQNQSRVFISSVLPGDEFVLVTLRNIYGKASSSVSSNYTSSPVQWHPIFSNDKIQAILVSKNDIGFRTGFWTIGVKGHSASDYLTKFTSFSMSKPIHLNSEPTIAVIPRNYTTITFQQFVSSKTVYINLNILYGSVKIEVYGKGKPFYTTTTNSTQTIGIPFPETLNIRITKLSNIADIAVIDILFSSVSGPFPLAIGQHFALYQDYGKETVYMFKVYNSRASTEKLRIRTESCDNLPAPVFCTHTDYFPSQCSKTFSSTPKSAFIQQYYFNPSATIPYYYIAVNSTSIFITVDSTHTISPSFPDNSRTIQGGMDANEKLRLYVKEIHPWSNTTYSVKIKPVSAFLTSALNFETLCVLKNAEDMPILNRNRIDQYTVELVTTAPSAGVKYAINVVAENHVQLAYQPVWYLNGVLYPMHQIVRVPVSIGMLVIGSVFHILLLYCFCGCLCNRCYRKKRGWHVIPNLSFWQDFPYLVWDGITFVCCCQGCGCKKPKSSYISEELEIISQCPENEFSEHLNIKPLKYGFGAGK